MASQTDAAGSDGIGREANGFTPGVVVALTPDVRRLVAPNASMMTGPGTNTYLIGNPVVAIVDPGPADQAHIDAIVSAAGAARYVFVTHTHADHSPAARQVAQRLGAELIGRAPPDDGRQDLTFVPDDEPVRGQRFDVGGLTIVAIDTPGHASNHVCYLLEEVGVLFSGDHLLEGVTPVILAPDGDMTAYLDSLERLKHYALLQIAPGHGGLFGPPRPAIDAVIAHRLRREAKALRALQSVGIATVDELLPQVYNDVQPALRRIARCSLEAHLIKLGREGRCQLMEDVWRIRA
ncbi:MAG TPA: MBL fold metallo-hydrolase [Steroidobacteraceae bacterium]|nr:MBL fold metallo-hydrolase [Steroidobacteraceae bacterium]